jgi:hypothetical protein
VLPWVQKSVRAWTFTLPSEFPFWELESRWIPKSSKGNCRGQHPLAWRLFYIIGNLLKRRCLKCARITHLDIWNTSYDQMKSRKSNWQFDSWPLKAANRPDSLVFRWRATHREKVLHKGYNFALDLIVIRGLPKLLESKLWEFRDSHLGIPGQNDIWMWPPWRGAEYTIRGKVVASPKSGPWWILWVRNCPWLVLAPKVLKLCTN